MEVMQIIDLLTSLDQYTKVQSIFIYDSGIEVFTEDEELLYAEYTEPMHK